ncbi:PREDICTED: uncharacterized protein LOC109591042 [Amphimedon queenslandica]|uniref:Uncharacterized protein n=1 Tax=Amphimedon queenslandica TaxID=400682 RepID=A0A1X7SXJ0_AMPQE|nr:PREDICTED: uncharacterized protein LOC109591042 [Amphimedon queenslandica]|eukprot:XP_019862412.1 PREDICTED: uncharacterized protein LOC109591042 [Amphimedon queenslandica]
MANNPYFQLLQALAAARQAVPVSTTVTGNVTNSVISPSTVENQGGIQSQTQPQVTPVSLLPTVTQAGPSTVTEATQEVSEKGSSQKYTYKVKILYPKRKREAVTAFVHNFHSIFVCNFCKGSSAR